MRSRTKTQRSTSPGEEVPWSSFADALAALLFVFILITLYFVHQLDSLRRQVKQEAENQAKVYERVIKAQSTADQLALSLVALGEASSPKRSIAHCLQKTGGFIIAVDEAETRISLHLTDSFWFQEASAEFANVHVAGSVKQVSACIESVLRHRRTDIAEVEHVRILLEGHTDALPMREGQETNWELSARRSSKMVREILKHSTDITNKLASGELELIPVGYGETRPNPRRICKKDESGNVKQGVTDVDDKPFCDCVNDGAGKGKNLYDLLTDCGAELEAATNTPPAFNPKCEPIPQGSRPPTFDSQMKRLEAWANRCPATAVLARRNEDRLSLLRRVDLRVEVMPKKVGDE